MVAWLWCLLQWTGIQRSRGALVDPLHVLLLNSPAVALQLMQFVRYDFSPWLQAAAIRVTGTLAGRDPNVVQLLSQLGDHASALVHGFSRYGAHCLSTILSIRPCCYYAAFKFCFVLACTT
ncbi:MAG: hypothetical protein HC767_14625 [Akkermansiaceae bacterium]|nr:hypothetical protein [Akkermansiaceae bacterium]